MPYHQPSFFDDTHALMSVTTMQRGTQCMCYTQQTNWIDMRLENLPPDESVVVDVGCGPRLPYQRSQRYFLVGVDASFESVRLNEEVDLRIFGSASCLPFKDNSIDVIVCFYLLHHLTGHSVSENCANLRNAFREFARVLKGDGHIYVFEVIPIPPLFAIQWVVWDLVRRIYPRLDMFFWSTRLLREIASSSLPAGTKLIERGFRCPFWVTFPFVFAWPMVQLPRYLFPFRARGFEWRLPQATV